MEDECEVNLAFRELVRDALQSGGQYGGGDPEYTTGQKAIGHILTIIAIGGILGITTGAILSTIWYFGYYDSIQDAQKIYEIGMVGCAEHPGWRAMSAYLTGAPSCGEVQTRYDNMVAKMLEGLTAIAKGILTGAGVAGLTFRAKYWQVYKRFMKSYFGKCKAPKKEEEKEGVRKRGRKEESKEEEGRKKGKGSQGDDQDEDEDEEKEEEEEEEERKKATGGSRHRSTRKHRRSTRKHRRSTRKHRRSTRKHRRSTRKHHRSTRKHRRSTRKHRRSTRK